MTSPLFSRLEARFDREARFTRRQLLQAGAAALAGTMLPSCRSAPEGGSRATAPRVCVIGAGLAGLACAFELGQDGYDVTVVEAKQRVGGRVLSRRDVVRGKNVEAGGDLVGLNHTTWLTYAKRFGLSMLEIQEEPGLAPVMFEGRLLSADEQKGLFDELKDAQRQINEQARDVDAGSPWLSPSAAERDALPAAEALIALDATVRAKRELVRQFAADNGAAVEDQSWLGNLALVSGHGFEAFWSDTEALRCDGGNQQLALRFADAIGTGRVRLGVPVIRVEAGESGVVVKLADLSRIEADHAVIAVCPGVWSRIEFAPPLPGDLKPSVGSAVKFLASLDGPFWKDAGQSPEARTDGAVSETWDATQGQTRGDGVCLTAYSGGPAAEACREFGKDLRVEGYLEMLGTLWPGIGRHFANSLFMDWPGDPWTGGAFSFPKPGEIMRLRGRLQEGLGRVQFAGEHLSSGFVGYMEGALRSGCAAATRIAAADGVAR